MITIFIIVLYLSGLYYLYSVEGNGRLRNTVGFMEPLTSIIIVIGVLVIPNVVSLGIFTIAFMYLTYVDLR